MRGPMPFFIPKSDRQPEHIQATVHLITGRKVPVTIVDKSQGGCTVSCLHPLPVGEVVQLEIPACMPCIVNIRWSVDGKSGLAFVN